jgi:hypothetical protein
MFEGWDDGNEKGRIDLIISTTISDNAVISFIKVVLQIEGKLFHSCDSSRSHEL